ncbi:MAG: hypothetical protein HYX88_01525 [Chloroflexi bacterium]|nr:hypothetical protein [Chloroflexota bacterium]
MTIEDTFPFLFQRLRLPIKGIGEGSRDDRKAYGLQSDKRSLLVGRRNVAGVGALSRRLMARERARVLGRKPLDPRVWDLEQEARRWAEEGDRR